MKAMCAVPTSPTRVRLACAVLKRWVATGAACALVCGCKNPTLVAAGTATPSGGAKGSTSDAAPSPTVAGGGTGTPQSTNPSPGASSAGGSLGDGPPAAAKLPARPSGWTLVKEMPTLDVLKKEGGGARLFLARIVLAAHAVRIAHTTGALKSTRALTSQCKVGVNTGYFSGAQSMSLIAVGGKVVTAGITQLKREGVNKYPARGALGLSKGQARVGWASPRAGVVYIHDAPPSLGAPPAGGRAWNADAIMGGGPVLLKGGQPRVTWQEELFDAESGIGPTAKNPRTAAGTDASGGILYLLVSDGRSFSAAGHTLANLADILRGVGAADAVNFDGGGSSTFVMDGRLLNSPSDGSERAVFSALCVN